MDALRFELSSASLTSSVVASSLRSHSSRPFFSSVQQGRVSSSSPAVGLVTKTTANEICTADELHYVPVTNSDWRVALWRYLPSPKVEVSIGHTVRGRVHVHLKKRVRGHVHIFADNIGQSPN